MNKLKEQLDNLDRIEMKIKYNDGLKKNKDGEIFKEIGKLNQVKKNDLDEKIKVIEKFIIKLDALREIKPIPSSLDNKLVEYIDYENFYNQDK